MDLGIPVIDVSEMVFLAEPIYLGGLALKPITERFVIESLEKLPELKPEQVGFQIYCTFESFSYAGVQHKLVSEPKPYCRVYFNCEQTQFGVRDVSGNFHPFDSAGGDKILLPL